MRLVFCCVGLALGLLQSADAKTQYQPTSTIILTNRDSKGWRTEYDGVQASASFTFNVSSVVDNEKVIQNRQEAFELLMLECGIDGYAMSFSVPHRFSSLKADGLITLEYAGRRYKFYQEKNVFLANQKNVPRAQFNQLLADLYQRSSVLETFHLRAHKADINFNLSGPLGSASSRRAAIGLIRSACR